MNRNDLDSFVEHYALNEAGVAKAFELTNAMPTRAETREFLFRVVSIGGVLSLTAGVVFFIAANWDALGVLGHFALVQSFFVVAVGVALWRPPPLMIGRLALLGAFITAGGLLALFGQTYQTGADVYELFFTWALLGLPLVLASHWSVCWAAWLVVLNVALMLFCGFMPAFGLLGVVFAGWMSNQAANLLIPMAVNLAVWFIVAHSGSARVRAVAPQWLGRLAVSLGVAYATWSGTHLLLDDDFARASIPGPTPTSTSDLAIWGILIAALAAVAWLAFRKRDDVLPIAAISGCAIFLGLISIAIDSGAQEMGLFFLMAFWLIGTSTVAGRLLMKLQRAWRLGGAR